MSPSESETPPEAEHDEAGGTDDEIPGEEPRRGFPGVGLAVIGISGLIVLILVGGLALAGVFDGDGDSAGSPSLSDIAEGDVAYVAEATGDAGNISQQQYERSFTQAWTENGLQRAPEPGDDQYALLKEAALEDVIDQAWLTSEAAERGIEVSDREIETEFQALREDQFADDAQFDKFLEDSGFTLDEIMERVRLQLLSRGIEEDVTEPFEANDEKQEAMNEFVETFTSKWRARTICAEGYLAGRCSNGESQFEPESAGSDPEGTTG